jgi:hypothetical protein
VHTGHCKPAYAAGKVFFNTSARQENIVFLLMVTIRVSAKSSLVWHLSGINHDIVTAQKIIT